MAISWLLCAALWACAFIPLRRKARLSLCEAWLAAGLLVCAEACAVILAAGALAALTPSVVRLAGAGLLALHLGAALALRGEDAPRRRLRWAVSFPWPLWPAAAVAAAVAAFRLCIAWKAPIESWDGLSYHVPLLWRWVQQGNLDLAGFSGPARYFPWNGEFLPAWLCLLDGGRLDSIKITQTLAYPLWIAACGALGRRLGGPRWTGACALAGACVPIAMLHLGVPYVDLFYSAFWLAAAAAAAAYEAEGRALHLALYALGFGLALGTKSTIYFQAPLLLPVLWTLARQRRWRKPALKALPLLILAVALTGGLTYIRNWIQTGSPIYPYVLKIAGLRVFDGITEPGELLVTVESWFVPNRLAWLWYPFRETRSGIVAYTLENGFGPLFAAGWALLPLAWWSAWRRRGRAALGFLALLPGVLFFFFLMHPTREPRYVIFLAPMPILALAVTMRRVSGRARAYLLSGWALGAMWACLGVLAFCGQDQGTLKAWESLKSHGTVDPGEYYVWQYGSMGEAWRAINPLIQPGDMVATNYGELVLPWAGTPPRGRVRVVRHKQDDYPESLFAETDEDWMFLLDDIDARFFGLWFTKWYPDVGLAEQAAIARFPQRFRKLGAWDHDVFGRVELYEILPPQPAAAARISPANPGPAASGAGTSW